MRFSESEIFQEVHTGPRGAQLLCDGAYIVKNENWFQLVSPNRLEASRNEVIASKISLGSAVEKVDEVIDFYKRLGTSFKWVVTPNTEPKNFGQILKDKGFRSWFGRGMYCFIDEVKIDAPKEVIVEKVKSENLQIYVDLFIEGWGHHKGLSRSLMQDYTWALNQSDKRFHYYIAKRNGEAVGTAGFIQKEKSAYLIGGNVLERHQGKGVYRALIKARLDALSGMGIPLATTGTREKTSSPILEELGFKTAYRDEIFQYDL